jgi:hypothetical protein
MQGQMESASVLSLGCGDYRGQGCKQSGGRSRRVFAVVIPALWESYCLSSAHGLVKVNNPQIRA